LWWVVSGFDNVYYVWYFDAHTHTYIYIDARVCLCIPTYVYNCIYIYLWAFLCIIYIYMCVCWGRSRGPCRQLQRLLVLQHENKLFWAKDLAKVHFDEAVYHIYISLSLFIYIYCPVFQVRSENLLNWIDGIW
jgi:hypothetical protein